MKNPLSVLRKRPVLRKTHKASSLTPSISSVCSMSQDSKSGAFHYRVSMKRTPVRYKSQEEKWSTVFGGLFFKSIGRHQPYASE